MTLPLLLLLACTAGDKGTTDTADDGLDCGNPQTFYPDADGDGYGATDQPLEECRAPDGYTRTPGDCDDGDAAVSPAGTEICNGVDDDCDGTVDPATAEDTITCHMDADGDGFGDPDTAEVTCACAEDQVTDATDCDDSDPSVYPGAEEIIYDGIDQACDGNAGEYDRDGDGYNASGTGAEPEGDCDDDDVDINPGMLDICDDDIDQDCDGLYDECGLDETMTPDDAWWMVSRDVTIEGDSAVFGWQPVFAGDGDGDGAPELLVKETALYNDEQFCRFHLVEAPVGTSGGEVLLDDVVTATWDFPATLGCETHVAAPHSMANVDLNDDGFVDYILNPAVGQARDEWDATYLALGPVDGLQDPSELDRVHATATLTPMGPARLLEEGTGTSDRIIAQMLWPEREEDEGTVHRGVAMLSVDDYMHGGSLDDAPAIWTSGGDRELRDTLIVSDVDGDGVRDMVASARTQGDPEPTGRVWFLRGPFEDDRSLADADVILDRGAADATSFGMSLDLLDDADGDGHRTLLVGDPTWRDDQTEALQLFEISELPDGIHLGVDEAFARIDGTAPTSDDEGTNPAFLPSALLPDLDADGENELAVPTLRYAGEDTFRVHIMDVPTAGVVTLADPTYLLTTSEHLDNDTGFGARIMGDHDLDGDGWNDLLIGEPYWNADPDNWSRPYGRFMVFRGDFPR